MRLYASEAHLTYMHAVRSRSAESVRGLCRVCERITDTLTVVVCIVTAL